MKIKELKKLALQKREPFIYDWLNIRPVVIEDNNDIAAVDSKNLYIGGKFFDLTDDEKIGVLYHESLHVYLNHLDRKDMPNRKKANISMDIIINEMLENKGYTLPQNGCFRRDFDIPKKYNTSKKIYDFLPDSEDEKCDSYEVSKDISDEGISQEEQIILGKLFGSIEEKNKNIKPKDPIPFDVSLQSHIGRLIKRSVSRNFSKPSRRNFSKNIISPNTRGVTYIPKINIYIDTSGSMEGDISSVIGAVGKCKTKLRQYEPTYYGFNTQTYKVNNLSELKCGGGTEFSRVEGKPDLHIIITDGELDWSYLNSIKNKIIYIVENGCIRQKV